VGARASEMFGLGSLTLPTGTSNSIAQRSDYIVAQEQVHR